MRNLMFLFNEDGWVIKWVKPVKLHLGRLPIGMSLFSETPVRRPVGQIRYLVGEVHSNTIDGKNLAPAGM